MTIRRNPSSSVARSEHVVRTDVLVVGAGPAGITLCSELIKSGFSITLVESGNSKIDDDEDSSGSFVAQSDEFESLLMYRRKVLGGASSIWGGRCVPFDPIDFKYREWIPYSGWPIQYDEVDRWYSKAAYYCEIGDSSFSAKDSFGPHYQFIDGLDVSMLSTDSIERFSPPTNFAKRWLPTFQAEPNFRLITDSTCVHLHLTTDAQNVSISEFRNNRGEQFFIEARVVVLAAGGLENCRLLLASNSILSNGIGNSGDALGRFLMTHYEGSSASLILDGSPKGVDWGFPITKDGVYARTRITIPPDVQMSDKLANFMVRLHHPTAVDPSHGNAILSLMFFAKRFILKEYRRKVTMVERKVQREMARGLRFWLMHGWNILVGLPQLGKFLVFWLFHRILSYRKVPYVALPSKQGVYPIDYNMEQLPNPASRVFLDTELDAFGVPKAIVDWQMYPYEVSMIANNLTKLRDGLAGSGAAKLQFADDDLEKVVAEDVVPVGGHFIGTTRMSSTPQDGVVDGNLKVHDVENLYVVGASVFPTSSHANPTFTIVALACRLAAHLSSLDWSEQSDQLQTL